MALPHPRRGPQRQELQVSEVADAAWIQRSEEIAVDGNAAAEQPREFLSFPFDPSFELTFLFVPDSQMELWSLLYFLMPAGMQAEGTGFANHKEFSEWFSSEFSCCLNTSSLNLG